MDFKVQRIYGSEEISQRTALERVVSVLICMNGPAADQFRIFWSEMPRFKSRYAIISANLRVLVFIHLFLEPNDHRPLTEKALFVDNCGHFHSKTEINDQSERTKLVLIQSPVFSIVVH